MASKIKVGILISYDYEKVFTCIKYIYEHVDEIYLALDINRKTWSGNIFNFDESFFKKIQLMDLKSKIRIYEDNFYIPQNTSIQNDTNERNLLAKHMGDGWCLQIDADEYIYDFEKLAFLLKKINIYTKLKENYPIVLYGRFLTLFKKLDNGYLYIENNERFAFGTNAPNYTYCRNQTAKINYQTEVIAIHESWARTDEEIFQKIKNWGHNKDFDTDAFYNFWKNINSENYKNIKDFHPMDGITWNKLQYLEATSVEDFIEKYKKIHPQKISSYRKILIKGNLKYYKKLMEKLMKVN